MSFKSWFSCLFNSGEELTIEEKKSPIAPDPLPPHITIDEALRTAIAITSRFEGNNGFGNVVGNFDGQGITCGALGFAWAQGIHQEIVLEAARTHGLIESRMPKYGKEYRALCTLKISESLPQISEWTDSSGKIVPVFYSELKSFWSCPDMVDLQVKQAANIGQHAYREASYWSQQYRRLVSPTLHEFVFFFDIIVQNGSSGIKFDDVKAKVGNDLGRAFQEVVDFLRWYQISDNQYLNKEDAGNNGKFWASMEANVAEEQKYLLIMAYLRARKSADKYQGNVLNRKGTIAMRSGYVNKTIFHLGFDHPGIMQQIVL